MGDGIRKTIEAAGNGSRLMTGIFRLIIAPLVVAGIGAMVAITWSSNASVAQIETKLEGVSNAMSAFISAQQGRDGGQDNRLDRHGERLRTLERRNGGGQR